jgi:hypothetical protein
MKLKSILFSLVICGIVYSKERNNYFYFNYALLFQGEASIGYQHIFKKTNGIGIIADYKASWKNRRNIETILFEYDKYTKENYYGFWFAPGLGFSYSHSEQSVPLKIGIGYHWITTSGIGLGFSFQPGIDLILNRINKPDVFFLGIADIGYAF